MVDDERSLFSSLIFSLPATPSDGPLVVALELDEPGPLGLEPTLQVVPFEGRWLEAGLARRLRRENGSFLTTTSLNRTGEPAARSIVEARLLAAVEQRARAIAGKEPSPEALKEAIERATICIDEIDKMSSIVAGKPNAMVVSLTLVTRSLK